MMSSTVPPIPQVHAWLLLFIINNVVRCDCLLSSVFSSPHSGLFYIQLNTMDAYFNKILAANKSDVRFIPSKTFTGRKNDFVFRNGDQGVGYYYDLIGASPKENVVIVKC